MTRRRDPIAEARRLRAVADDLGQRYRSLDQRRIDSLEMCAPAPRPDDIEAARRLWLEAEALADEAARRIAGLAVTP